MSQKLDRGMIMSSWLIRIVLIILVLVLGYFLGGWYAQLKIDGKFEEWQYLGTPPEKVVKISAHNGLVPFVETSDGTAFRRYYPCTPPLDESSPEDDCWVRLPLTTLRVVESSSCHPDYEFKVPQPPGEILDMIEIQKCEGGIFRGTQGGLAQWLQRVT
jgi:hypothetical protein